MMRAEIRDVRRDSRRESGTFDIIQAAQRFVIELFPLRDGESSAALAKFLCVLDATALDRITAEAAFVTLLHKIGASAGLGGETLLGRYFSLEASTPDPVDRFRRCLLGLLRARGVRHPAVAATIDAIDARFCDSTLRLDAIARDLCLSPAHLAHLLVVHTGRGFRAHLHEVRMREAAQRLAAACSIKSVASAVGYGHVADFDHHFKRWFGVTPTMFRSRQAASGLVTGPRHSAVDRGRKRMTKALLRSDTRADVLIVDDDLGTRETFAALLRLAGHVVLTADTQVEARRFLQRHTPSLVIVDRWIRNADATTFARELASQATPTSVVLMTADPTLDLTSIRDLRRAGIGVMFKPITGDELLAVVKRSVPRLES